MLVVGHQNRDRDREQNQRHHQQRRRQHPDLLNSKQAPRFVVGKGKLSLCLTTLLVLVGALFLSQQMTFGAFVAANEQVGYRACVHLMLRLVDCLIDACDLYLAQLSPGPALDTPPQKPLNGQEPISVDASNLLNDKGNIRIEAVDKDLLWPIDEFNGGQEEYPSTKPMNWVAPAALNDPLKTNSTFASSNTTTTTTTTTTVKPLESTTLSKEIPPAPLLSPESQLNGANPNLSSEDDLKTSSCWPKAIKWIKEQLIVLRMNLMNGAKASLRDTLDRFGELNAYLVDVCPTLAIGDSQPKMDHLGYVVEAIEVLNQINEDSKEKAELVNGANNQALVDQIGEKSKKEKAATDSIKENYSYLTQIITSYNLVFNGIDGDIMGQEDKEEGCSKCTPCPTEQKACSETCLDCKLKKCPPCKLPNYCRAKPYYSNKDNCPQKPACELCSSNKAPESPVISASASTSKPAPKLTKPPNKTIAEHKTTESSSSDKHSAKTKPYIRSTQAPNAAADQEDDARPPKYILDEVRELMEAEREANMTQTSSSSEEESSSTTSTLTTTSDGKVKEVSAENKIKILSTKAPSKNRRKRNAKPTTVKPATTGKPTSTSKPTTTGKPTTTSEPTTTGKPTTTSKPSTTGKPGYYKKIETHKSSKTSEKNRTEFDSDDGKGNKVHKVTESTHKTSSQFHGVQLFYKHLSALKTDDATRDAIMKMVESIPPTLGGEDSLMAQGILAKFGESPMNLMKKKGTTREFTVESAKTKLMAIIGHLLDRKVRKECDCPKCNICRCKLIGCKSQNTTCGPCPPIKNCIYPPGCPIYKPCSGCTNHEDPDNDGPEKDLDDIDPVDPIQDRELEKPVECKTGATCPKTTNFTCGLAPLNPFTPEGNKSEYMVGGEDIKYGEYPQFARLEIQVPGKISGGLCGGTLISDSHVITAGHCVQVKESNSKRNYTRFEPQHFKVFLGDYERFEKDKYEQERKVTHVTFSSKFNIPDEEGSRYDYAILTLDKPVKFDNHVRPACLPYKKFNIKPRTICYAIGIGITKYDKKGGHHKFAKKVQKMRVSRASCKSWGFKHDDRSRHCFTKAAGKGDSCGGDSGGPVLCLDHKSRWTLMGMVSYGAETCDGSETTGWVAVYTRIRSLLRIIKKDSEAQNPNNPI